MQILLWCPRCWRVVGSLMFTVCSAFALIGLRMLSRVDRIDQKFGVLVNLDKAFAAIPLPIPTSKGGVALALLGAVLGLVLARFGRWGEKLY